MTFQTTHPPELPHCANVTFIAACCRWPLRKTDIDVIAQSAKDISDWDAVLHDIQRHRVELIIARALGKTPDSAAPLRMKLRPLVQPLTLRNLAQAAETARLTSLFRSSGLRVVSFKGVTLEHRVYGQLGLKHCFDIDLYVARTEAEAAISCLEAEGYRIALTGQISSSRARKALIRNCKDIAFTGPSGRVVELHWRLTALPGLMRNLETGLSYQSFSVPGLGPLDTFDDKTLFAYLCAHGAHHDWVRLKWLVDVAAYWNSLSEQDRADCLCHAQRLGAGPSVSQMFHLAHHFLGLEIPPAAMLALNAHLVSHAARQIVSPYAPELQNPLINTRDKIRRKWIQRHLYKTPHDALRILFQEKAIPQDVLAFPLPAALNWLYAVTRLPSYILRRGPDMLQRLIMSSSHVRSANKQSTHPLGMKDAQR